MIKVDIKPGDVLIGLASYGQSIYEKKYNSGIGSNGLTAARHDLLSKYYLENFSETVAPQTNPEFVYTGPFRLTDQHALDGIDYTIGELLTSPTRTYVPFLNELLNVKNIRPGGLIHCTGGAHTKVKKFIKNLKIIKDQLFDAPPVFNLISKHSLCSKEELYEVYNMGQRLEIYAKPSDVDKILRTAELFKIDAKVMGRVEAYDGEMVELHSPWGVFQY